MRGMVGGVGASRQRVFLSLSRFEEWARCEVDEASRRSELHGKVE